MKGELKTEEYQKAYSYSTSTTYATKSNELIDNSTTYQVFFNLDKTAQCIDVSVIAQEQNKKRVRCAFIVEYMVDTSSFLNKPSKPVYTELSRNFDINWRFLNVVTICSDKTDPLKRLKPGSYRIRFTAFRNNYYDFIIEIKSAVPVIIIK